MNTELLTAEQTAEALQVAVQTLRRWVANGEFPPPVRIGRRIIRWRRADIEAATGVELNITPTRQEA